MTSWLKQVVAATGQVTREELDERSGPVLERTRRKPNPMSLPQPKGSVRLFAEQSERSTAVWFASPGVFGEVASPFAGRALPPPPPTQRLVHAAALNAGERAWVFLEYAEHRDEALEQAASASEAALKTWIDWLEGNGDPYAAPLRAMLAGRVFSGRERWWLEGIDRGMRSLGKTFGMRGGFLRHAEIAGGTLPIDLHLHHLLALRVARALEELTIDLIGFLPAARLVPFAESSFWTTAHWPPSLQTLRLTCNGASALETRRCADILRPKLSGIHVEG